MGRLMPMTVIGKLGTVAVAALVLAACGATGAEVAVDRPQRSGSTTAASGTSSSSTLPPSTTEVPSTDPQVAEELVLRIDRGVGAFTTIDTAFAEIPVFLLTSDGRVVSPGPQIAIYPAPLLPALQFVQLGDADVRAAIEVALDHDLDEDFVDQSLMAVIADVGSTVVRLQLEGVLTTSDVYGLGLAPEQLSPELAARHRSLVAAIDELTARFGQPAGGPSGVFEPDAYVMGVQPVDPAALASADVESTVWPWPDGLGDQSASCQVLDGPAVRAALATATQLTFFELADGSLVKPLLRPLLAGSSGCGS